MTALEIPQGSTWALAIPLRDAEGEPLNLTGWSARAQVRANKWFRDLPVLHEWRTTGVSPNATLSNSELVLTVTPAVSSAWAWYSGHYDVELTDPTGRIARILSTDEVTVLPEVTHDD